MACDFAVAAAEENGDVDDADDKPVYGIHALVAFTWDGLMCDYI